MIPTPVTGTGGVTPALICSCCVLGRWSTLLPVWWCCTGPGEAQGVLEVAARDITGGTRTAFDGEGPGAWEWAALGIGDGGLGRKRAWAGVEEQEKGVALLLCQHREGVLGGLERLTPFPRVSSPPLSLAVHPDGVRVASGQTAGVDKDGKVRPKSNPGRQDEMPAELSFSSLTPPPAPAPAACGSRLGLRDAAEAAGDRTGGLRAGCGGPGLFSSGELAPKPLDPHLCCLGIPVLVLH